MTEHKNPHGDYVLEVLQSAERKIHSITTTNKAGVDLDESVVSDLRAIITQLYEPDQSMKGGRYSKIIRERFLAIWSLFQPEFLADQLMVITGKTKVELLAQALTELMTETQHKIEDTNESVKSVKLSDTQAVARFLARLLNDNDWVNAHKLLDAAMNYSVRHYGDDIASGQQYLDDIRTAVDAIDDNSPLPANADTHVCLHDRYEAVFILTLADLEANLNEHCQHSGAKSSEGAASPNSEAGNRYFHQAVATRGS